MEQFCVYCGEGFEVNKDLITHRKTCSKNPKSVENKAIVKAEKRKPYTDLQRAVTSYDDIFDRLDAFLLEKGFKITWIQRPSQWVDVITDSFRGDVPLVPSASKAYGGWKGRWEGKIDPIEGVNDDSCSFSDLMGNWSDSKFDFKFLRTNSGSFGSHFSGNGYLLVNDFPKLVDLHISKTANAVVNNGLDEALNKIDQDLRKKMDAEIVSDEFMRVSTDFIIKMEGALGALKTEKATHKNNLVKNFKARVKVDLPKLENPFVDLIRYNEMVLTYKDLPEVHISASVERATDKIETLMKDFKEFQDAHPEHFI